MQYQPGSWYLPWGIPLQKMLTIPYPQSGSPNAATISPYATTNNAALTCQVLPNNAPNNVNNNAATIQVQSAAAAAAATHNYQHATFHPNSVGAFACGNVPSAIHHNTTAVTASNQPHSTPSIPSNILNGNGHSLPHIQSNQLQNNHIQQPNSFLSPAAAIFSPLALQAYLASSATSAIGNPICGMSNQATLSGCTKMLTQQTSKQISTPTTVPLSTSPQSHHNHNHNHQHHQPFPAAINLNVDVVAMRPASNLAIPLKKVSTRTSFLKVLFVYSISSK